MRRIGVLMPSAADDAEFQARMTAFVEGLAQLGWLDGRNVRIDARWGVADADRIRKYATELLALAPDVILANSSAALAPLLQATRTVPIVFTTVADPIGAGYVDSLAQPGGNATGFLVWEYSIAAKWLELLKEIAPHVTRAMVFRQSAVAAGPGQFGVIQAAAPSLGVDLRVADVRDAGEIERAVTTFAQGSNGGLIVTGSPGGHISSYVDRCACRSAPLAGGLPGPLLRRPTSIASSKARSPPTCRCRRQPSTSWRSTSKPRRRSASPSRRKGTADQGQILGQMLDFGCR
jgi:ABC transporter substrate binding protein